MSADLLDTAVELSNVRQKASVCGLRQTRSQNALKLATAAVMRGEAEAEAARLPTPPMVRTSSSTLLPIHAVLPWSIATDDQSLILTTDNDFLKSLQSRPAAMAVQRRSFQTEGSPFHPVWDKRLASQRLATFTKMQPEITGSHPCVKFGISPSIGLGSTTIAPNL